MTRELRSATEIHAEISRLIQASADVEAAKATIIVPHPKLTTAAEGGCNWTIPEMAGASLRYADSVARSIEDVKSRWDLRP